jgi:hypothetical protein
MREIQASESKTHLRETIVIIRHGRAIARIVLETHLRQAEVDRAVVRAVPRSTSAEALSLV